MRSKEFYFRQIIFCRGSHQIYRIGSTEIRIHKMLILTLLKNLKNEMLIMLSRHTVNLSMGRMIGLKKSNHTMMIGSCKHWIPFVVEIQFMELVSTYLPFN